MGSFQTDSVGWFASRVHNEIAAAVYGISLKSNSRTGPVKMASFSGGAGWLASRIHNKMVAVVHRLTLESHTRVQTPQMGSF